MSSNTPTSDLRALKATALLATLTIATARTTTSLLYIPSLLKPLSDPAPPFTRKNSYTNTPSLAVPQTPTGGDGRLTPQPFGTFDFSTGSSGTYKAIARQFSALDKASALLTTPLEIFALGVFGLAAFRGRNSLTSSVAAWKQYATAAGLLGSVIPLTMVWMAPLVHKIKRIGGEEEKIEPYEDAPIDLEAEKSNTVEFLGSWSLLNLGRGIVGVAAGILGTVALLDE